MLDITSFFIFVLSPLFFTMLVLTKLITFFKFSLVICLPVLLNLVNISNTEVFCPEIVSVNLKGNSVNSKSK